MDISLKWFMFLCSLGFIDAVKLWCDYHYRDGVGYVKYNRSPMTWFDARQYCQLQGAELASPTNSDIKVAMVKQMDKAAVFTGFHSTDTKRQYNALDGASLSDIPHTWADSNNKNAIQSCIVLNADGNMLEVNCNEKRLSLCHIKNTTAEVNECGTLDPEYQLDNRTKKCYKLHRKLSNLDQAHFICNAEGGRLATLSTEEEADVMKEIYRSNHRSNHVAEQPLQDTAVNLAEEPKNAQGHCEFLTPGGSVNNFLFCENVESFFCMKYPSVPAICDHFHEVITFNNAKPINL